MPWLNVPHHKQSKVGWCLPACITMVAEYWGHTFSQVEIARWLGARGGGVPASRVQRLTEHGFDVAYCTGSLNDAEDWLNNGVPVILFLRTGELPYWEVDTPHAVVLIGIETETTYLLDPAHEDKPIMVDVGDLMLAWSYFDYTYATLRLLT